VPRVLNQFSGLKQCQYWREAEHRLRAGQSARAVAAFLKMRGDYPEGGEESLARQLRRWMRSEDLRPGALARATYKADGEEARELTERLAELDRLIVLQVERVEYDHKLEVGLGTLLPSQRAEIQLLHSMLMRAIEARQELGLLPKFR